LWGVSNSEAAEAVPFTLNTVLTTAGAIQRLSPAEANRNLPVQLRAVVTASNKARRTMFVEDGTTGIYCELGALMNVPAPGEDVELLGATGAGGYFPIIYVTSLRSFGPTNFPPPRPVTVNDLWAGKYDGDFVRATGFVTHIEAPSGSSSFTRYHIIGDGLTAYILMPGTNTFPVDELPGAQVEVTGVFGPTLDRLDQISSVGIMAARPDFVRFVDRANDVLASLQPVTIRNVFTMTNRMARIRGTVMLAADAGFWIGDGTNGINVVPVTRVPVRRGEIVEVAGLVRENAGEVRLRLYRLMNRTNGPSLVPIAVTAVDCLIRTVMGNF